MTHSFVNAVLEIDSDRFAESDLADPSQARINWEDITMFYEVG